MATLYNNGTGFQSVGNMGPGMAAAYEAYRNANLAADSQATKKASDNFQKDKALHSYNKPSIEEADKAGQKESDALAAETIKESKNITIADIEEVKPDTFEHIDDDNVGKIDNNLLAEYGNNFFELITYDETLEGEPYNKKLSLAGVLKDVPSFSMAAEWITGPVATVADTVKDWFCSPTMEIVMGIGGKDRSWMNLDEGTDRIYSKVSQKPSFNLNFKIYTTENIGSKSLTTWKTWLKALSLYAMPSINNKISINAMGNQVIEGVNGAFGTIKKVFNATKNSLTSDVDKDMLDKLGDALESAANTTEQYILHRDGPGRVQSTSNSESYYGSKIWYLRILPGIFAKPLIVYISNWGVTYSKELNISTGEPIWVEFKITCELDQIPSAPTWMKYLSNDAGENGEIPKTYMNELGKKNLKHSDYIQRLDDLIEEDDKHE